MAYKEHKHDNLTYSIGKWKIGAPTVLAPMAGITDYPFRRLCRRLGAGLAVSEMLTSDTKLWHSRKSQQRLPRIDEQEPRAVQIAGNDPAMMAEAARVNVELGAQVIDINMGCPAKKVCRKAAGSALLRDEKLVADILASVVSAVDVPVTLKIRTGWSPDHRNGVKIARIAEDQGIQALAVHGRTRACAFKGAVEYQTIASIVQAVDIPVLANGDITSPEQAKNILEKTGASGLMVGRGAQGNPWLFREINYYLQTGKKIAAPQANEVIQVISEHIKALYRFYGEQSGVRIARKHVSWYLQGLLQRHIDVSKGNEVASSTYLRVHQRYQNFRQTFNRIESEQNQFDELMTYLETFFRLEEQAA